MSPLPQAVPYLAYLPIYPWRASRQDGGCLARVLTRAYHIFSAVLILLSPQDRLVTLNCITVRHLEGQRP